ncbi:MAG: hypothetical protein NVSMB65_21250 [Chloroflexota bacterium]
MSTTPLSGTVGSTPRDPAGLIADLLRIAAHLRACEGALPGKPGTDLTLRLILFGDDHILATECGCANGMLLVHLDRTLPRRLWDRVQGLITNAQADGHPPLAYMPHMIHAVLSSQDTLVEVQIRVIEKIERERMHAVLGDLAYTYLTHRFTLWEACGTEAHYQPAITPVDMIRHLYDEHGWSCMAIAAELEGYAQTRLLPDDSLPTRTL